MSVIVSILTPVVNSTGVSPRVFGQEPPGSPLFPSREGGDGKCHEKSFNPTPALGTIVLPSALTVPTDRPQPVLIPLHQVVVEGPQRDTRAGIGHAQVRIGD